MDATLKVHKWTHLNVYSKFVKGPYRPDQSLLSALMNIKTIKVAGEHQ